MIALNRLATEIAIAIANHFTHRPKNYQPQIESTFVMLTHGSELMRDTIAILKAVEQDLSQWYGDRRLLI